MKKIRFIAAFIQHDISFTKEIEGYLFSIPEFPEHQFVVHKELFVYNEEVSTLPTWTASELTTGLSLMSQRQSPTIKSAIELAISELTTTYKKFAFPQLMPSGKFPKLNENIKS